MQDADIRLVEIEDRDVGALAGLQRPDLGIESERLRAYLVGGGNLLAAVGPINASNDKGMAPAGLDPALAPFGIALDDDLVFETDPKAVIPGTRGVRLLRTAWKCNKSPPVLRQGSPLF